jgi:hypothetical protein
MSMTIEIKNDLNILDVQTQFQRYFPHLNVQFFEVPHSEHQPLDKQLMYPESTSLRKCRKLRNEGVFEINNDMTVAELEQGLWDQFGLSVQVFRQSGRVWIQTSLTDDWSLSQQEGEGKEMAA